MKIAEVSKRYGVSTDTLRYYERIGLLRHVPRNKSGIRDYDEASCNAVEFVKCMRDAGMSIESLRSTWNSGTGRRDDGGPQGTAHGQSEIRERIVGLERPLARLEYKIEHRRGQRRPPSGLCARGSNRCETRLFRGRCLESFVEPTPAFIMAFRETN
ncbi:MAG: MerR family transcriptional regulator [Adlercreutzia sp.]